MQLRGTHISILVLLGFYLISTPLAGQTSALLEMAKKYVRSNPDSAIYYSGQAMKDTKLSDSLRLELLLIQTDAYRMKGILDDFKRQLAASKHLNQKVKNPLAELTITNLSGLYHWRLTNFDSAIHYFLKVREQAFLLLDTIGIIKSYNNLGIIFSDIGDSERALEEYMQGIRFAELKKDSIGLIHLFNGVSNHYREVKDFDKAINYINRSIAISAKKRNLVDMQRGYSNRGATYFRMSEYKLAEESLLQSLQISEEQYIAESLAKIYYHLAEVYIATKQYDKAESFAQKVLDIAIKENFTDDIKYGHEILYLVAKARGNYSEALARHELYMAVKDSIFDKEHLENITEIETKYRTAQKDLELQKLASDIEHLDRNKKLTHTRIIFISVGLALFTVAYFLDRSRRDILKKKIQREEYSAGILQSREEERKGLSKDLHDHVGQNLVLLNQSLIKGDISASKEITQGVIDDIRRVARELYPWQIDKLGLEAAIKDLIHTTEQMTDILLTYEIDPLDGLIDREKSLQLYRIVQECLNNLVKHSKAISAKISIDVTGQQLQLTIQDNGAGFDYKMEMNNSKSLGLMTLKDRVQSMRGKLEVESVEGKGSRFSFSIPVA